MRRSILVSAIFACLAQPAGSAGASLLLEGSVLEIRVPADFSATPTFTSLAFPQVGSAPAFELSGGAFILQPGLMSGVATHTFPPTSVSLLTTQIWDVANGSGAMAPGLGIGGGFGGAAPLGGTLNWRSLGFLNLSIPLAVVGGGGAVPGTAAALMITVTGHLWTTGPATVSGVTDLSVLSGYDNRTAGHRGSIQLVSPIRAVTGALGNVPMFAVQTLTFVPEPGTLALLAVGVGAAWRMAARARRRG